MKILLNIIFLMGCCAVFAQHPFSYSSTFTDGTNKLYGDTISLLNVEKHGVVDDQFRLGGAGSVSFPLVLDVNYFNSNAYTQLAFQNEPTFERFKVQQPITDVKYIIGSKKEQYFNVLHAQNMRRVNFSFGLEKVINEGFYLNQNTNNSHIYGNVNQQVKKYSYALDFDWNQKLQGLNGGFKNDSLFIEDSLSLSRLYDVNLLNASQKLRQINYRFLQQYKLSNSYDSTMQKRRESKLTHSIGYQSQTRNYYDTIGGGETRLNSDYYNGFTIDSIVANDDVKYQKIYSELKLSYSRNIPGSQIQLSGGVLPSYNLVKRSLIKDTSVFDMMSLVKIKFLKKDSSGLQRKGGLAFNYLLNDRYEKKDYEFDGYLELGTNKYKIILDLKSRRQRPQLDLLEYKGNSSSWNSKLDKTTLNKIGVVLETLHDVNTTSAIEPRLFINLYEQRNPIFFGYDGKPTQVDGFAQVIASGMDINFNTSSWSFKTKVAYQYQGGYNVFRLPEWYSNLQVGKNFSLFKNKMKLKAGIYINYFSKYNSKRFDASTGQFFIGTDQKVGGYPYADVFIKGRIQKVTYFIMSSHPHQGLIGNNYFTAPGYAANGRMLKLGINWLFLN